MKWLKTRGPAIVTEDGEPIRLRGVGVGGWLNMENFITGYPYTESSHRAAMHRVLGQRRYGLFFDSFLTHFFGSEDAAFIASLGLNCVRIPVNWRHWPDGFRHVDRAIDACAAAGLYTVIDLHAAPGYQNHHWHSDNPFHQPLFFSDPIFSERSLGLWSSIAARYAGRPEVAGYNILNEPADETDLALVDFYRRAVDTIRAVDGRHMVFLDGNRYAREFPAFGEPFENAVYAIHQYPAPGAADGGPYQGEADRAAVEADFRAMASYMREWDLPVWVGEFGPVYGAGRERDEQRRRLLADQIEIYEEAQAGWSVWTYKDIGVQGLVSVPETAPWMTRTAAVRAKKRRVAADHWGMTKDSMRDVLDPLLARFEREFPRFDPYPFGARGYVEHLVLNVCFAEPLALEFAECFADASDEELTALAGGFAFEACAQNKELCQVVSRRE